MKPTVLIEVHKGIAEVVAQPAEVDVFVHDIDGDDREFSIDEIRDAEKSGIPEWVKQTDWELFKFQKENLLQLSDHLRQMKEDSTDWPDAVDGIVNFLDAVQDWCTDDLGISDKK